MINPARYNLLCPQGVTFSKTFTIKVNGIPLDLTDYSAVMQIRESYDSEHPLITLSSENGGLVLGGSDGSIYMEIAFEDTETFEARHYVYDLELLSGSGYKDRPLYGAFIVSNGVTR